jgi:hypothetical protein
MPKMHPTYPFSIQRCCGLFFNERHQRGERRAWEDLFVKCHNTVGYRTDRLDAFCAREHLPSLPIGYALIEQAVCEQVTVFSVAF